MKIVIIGPAHPYRGGIAKFNETLAQNFARQGHEVVIANFTLQYPSFLFPGKSQYSDDPPPEGVTSLRIINSINPLSWFRAARRIRKESPDLVIVRYWMPFFAPALGTIAGRLRLRTTTTRNIAKRLIIRTATGRLRLGSIAGGLFARKVLRRKRVPTIALTDNIVPHEGHFYDKICTRYFLRRVNAVVYMSRQVGRELEQFKFTGKSSYSPHPIYDTYGERLSKATALDNLGLDPSYRYSLFFGFVRDYKGLDLLLESWAKLTDKNLRLIIAGEYYGDRARYDALLDSLGIGDRVIVRDQYIADNYVKYYFSAADIVIQPYRTATQSGVTQIAYHFGNPMIVTNVGGLAEIVPHGRAGYVVEQSSQELSAAITDFYSNNREAEMRQNVEIEKKRFEWAKMVENFVNLHESLSQQ